MDDALINWLNEDEDILTRLSIEIKYILLNETFTEHLRRDNGILSDFYYFLVCYGIKDLSRFSDDYFNSS